MRGKVNQVKSYGNLYGYRPLIGTKDKRLNLNNLLKRIKNEEKKDKKLNLLILSGAISAVIVFFLLLSI